MKTTESQIELKTLAVSPCRAIQQIVDYKNDSDNGYAFNQELFPAAPEELPA